MSNLTSFLQSVTPIVRSKPLPEGTSEYFTLGNVWDCYDEWSSYGVGAPITLKNKVPIIQYYVPYLSAIQIYTIESPTTLSSCRNLSEDNIIDENKFSKSRLGYLYFEFSEVATFKWRIPLADKVCELSKTNPGIMKLRSDELSPTSWMAITWCPISYVPMIEVTKKVSTYFLTYHTISSLFQENIIDETEESIPITKKKDEGIPLPPFGIESYMMENDVWMNKAQAHTKYGDLQGAANCWLKQLNFNHHDFNVFTSKENLGHIYFF